MSIHIDDEGRRSVRAEVEVPGTPEQVWEAIATGPGIASWFMAVDTEFDAEVGGKVRTLMGDQLVEEFTLTAWDPPRQFTAEGPGAAGPGSPRGAFEWTVEARSGGTCVVRLVQSLFTSDDAWDTQLGDAALGWPAFFDVLKAYLSRFRGQPCGIVQAMAPASGSADEAYARLATEFGLAGLEVGQAFTSQAEGAPPLSGTVDKLMAVDERDRRAMLHLESPLPGTAWVGVGTIAGQVTDIVSLYYYGEGAADAAARDQEVLGTWLQAHVAAVTS